MDSKGLKAIIIDPSERELAPIVDKEAFKEAAKRFAKALQEYPVTGQELPTYGTDFLITSLTRKEPFDQNHEASLKLIIVCKFTDLTAFRRFRILCRIAQGDQCHQFITLRYV